MHRELIRVLVVCGLLCLSAHRGVATTVVIHTDDARATLLAMQNPALSHEDAIKIAKMHGNQAVLRKLHEFKIPSTTEDFANALYASAHGQPVTKPTEKAILLDMVKPKAPQLFALVEEIERDPKEFQDSIEQRIAMYSPSNADIHLEGYVVAAGDGGGYTFGDTDFFLNVGMMDDFILAKSTTTHELYHAVQGAFATVRAIKFDTAQGRVQQACANEDHLFANLYEEGSAMYVEDISLVTKSHAAMAARMQADMDEGLAHLDNSSTLLEMSVLALNAAEPVPYDDVYDVGFFGHGVLYNVGYAMAKAIVDSDGAQGLAAFLKEPPEKFVLRYTQLPSYGTDKDHPRLGPNTVAAANRMLSECK